MQFIPFNTNYKYYASCHGCAFSANHPSMCDNTFLFTVRWLAEKAQPRQAEMEPTNQGYAQPRHSEL